MDSLEFLFFILTKQTKMGGNVWKLFCWLGGGGWVTLSEMFLKTFY